MNTQDTTQESTALAQTTKNVPVRAPAVDIFENNDQLLFLADMPGVANDAIDIRLDKGELTFEAQRDPKVTTEGAEAFLFRRTFVLPKGILPDKITANYENGVLRIEIPKTDAVKTRQIPVRAG